MIKKLIQNWSADTGGNIAMIFSLAATVIVPMVYFAIQIRSIESQKYTLQTAADNAALAVIKELSVISTKSDSLNSLALAQINANLSSNPDYLAESKKVEAELIPAGSRANPSDEAILQVTIKQLPVADYQTIFGFPEKTPIVVSARAAQVGSTAANVCVVGLSSNQSDTISLAGQSQLTANECLVYSNSTSPVGLVARDQSMLIAESIFSGGGTQQSHLGNNFDPEPVQDAPALEDPLSGRSPPNSSGCDFFNKQVRIGESETLQPGIYCGGLRIQDDAEVKLEPGIYVIKNGAMDIDNHAVVSGEGVGFYLVGGATVRLLNQSKVSLTAPVDGPMAGLLFFEQRGRSNTARHFFASTEARRMVGTIYLPSGLLVINSTDTFFDQSEYTAIVVKQLQLVGGPQLVMNTDYDETDVPVPDGLIQQSRTVRLID